jgi:hypothetical protein
MLAVAAEDGKIWGVLSELVVLVEPEVGGQEEILELQELQELQERAAEAAEDHLWVVPPELLEG